jgi:chromosome condensin MukBEF ATPase and DNA-binding subunit MukB
MHHAKNYANKIFPRRKMLPRTRRTARKHIDPIGVSCHQLALRHEDSSSGSNDPIGDIEAQVNRLQTELRRRTDIWVTDGDRINELRSDVRRLRDQLVDRDLALDWVVQSRSLAWAKEIKAQARVEELSSAIDDLQAYCNTLHDEVHVLYSQLHPSEHADPVGTEAGPSHVAGEVLVANWTFLGPLPL